MTPTCRTCAYRQRHNGKSLCMYHEKAEKAAYTWLCEGKHHEPRRFLGLRKREIIITLALLAVVVWRWM